jgi:hypothetical protein
MGGNLWIGYVGVGELVLPTDAATDPFGSQSEAPTMWRFSSGMVEVRGGVARSMDPWL